MFNVLTTSFPPFSSGSQLLNSWRKLDSASVGQCGFFCSFFFSCFGLVRRGLDPFTQAPALPPQPLTGFPVAADAQWGVEARLQPGPGGPAMNLPSLCSGQPGGGRRRRLCSPAFIPLPTTTPVTSHTTPSLSSPAPLLSISHLYFSYACAIDRQDTDSISTICLISQHSHALLPSFDVK